MAGGAERDALDILTDWAVTNGAFRRNKLGVRTKVLAGALAHSGVSYREASRMIGGMSYIAVRDCRINMERLLPEPLKLNRRVVALDEANLTLAEGRGYLWLARDVDSGQTLAFRFSFAGSPEDSASFCTSVLEHCADRPAVLMGDGSNRPRALKNVDLHFPGSGPSGAAPLIQRIIKAVSRWVRFRRRSDRLPEEDSLQRRGDPLPHPDH